MNARTLDPLLGTPARLAIVATLADGRDRTFSELKSATGLADGNLHVQASRLAEAGYLRQRRERRGGRSVTCYRLEEDGLEALRRLADRLQAALSGLRPPRPERRERDDSQVW
ncbi:MAG: transcriptional regulator [Krumholzibacteria bacterium]|jgi:DNA-binding transcriptional ArsR family regulator|nr:transcriptional regulator [Candidatus Krumholzibacteria bacterium]